MEILLLIAIAIYFLRKNKKIYRRRYRKQYNRQKTDSNKWKSEWIWDEGKQLWIHPLSIDHLSEQKINKTENKNETIDYSRAYQSKYLLTKNEWHQYKKLKEFADIKGYIVCPKVRLFDIIEPKKDHQHYKTLMYKIQAKHLDFVICDSDMQIKVVIELDDSSHDRKDRQERDAFVDLILRSVGYKVIHTRYITNDLLDLV